MSTPFYNVYNLSYNSNEVMKLANQMQKFKIKLRKTTKVDGDYYIFDFEKPEDMIFKEGQYGVFYHIDKDVEGRKMRAFSIASCFDENCILTAMKITDDPSDFKKKMLDLEEGSEMLFVGPTGKFTLEEDHNAVFIAGGIGITPIRGLIRQMELLGYDKTCELIYSEADEIYPFKEDFDSIEFINSHYEYTIKGTTDRILEMSSKYQNESYYYVSGSPGFITAIKEQLVSNGILNDHIKFDRFSGL